MVTFTPTQIAWLSEVMRVLDRMPRSGDAPGESDGLQITVDVYNNLIGWEKVAQFTEEENAWLLEVES